MPRMKHVAAVTILLLAALCGTLSGISGISVFGMLCASVTAALLAAVIFMYRRPLIIAAPLVSALSAALISGHTLSALTALLPLPVAVALAYSIKRGHTKSRAVVTASVLYGTELVIFVALYALFGGKLPAYNDIYGTIKEALLAAVVNTQNGSVAMFTEQSAAAIADYVMLSLPAVFIVSVSIASYIAASTLSFLLRLFSFGNYIPGGKWVYTPAVASAVLYILSYLISTALASDASADMLGFAAENLLLSLLPAMMLWGEKALYGFCLRHDKRVLFVTATILLVFSLPSLYLMLVSFSGAISLIYGAVMPHIKKLLPKNNDGDDDFDNYDNYDNYD